MRRNSISSAEPSEPMARHPRNFSSCPAVLPTAQENLLLESLTIQGGDSPHSRQSLNRLPFLVRGDSGHETIHEVLYRFSAEAIPEAGPQTHAPDSVALDASLIQDGIIKGHDFLPASLSENTITSFSVSRNSSTLIGFVR